mgnify:CR=1 FL=1
MKGIRPFGWVIIALNAYFFVSFFMSVDTSSTADSTATGLGFMFLIFWLAIMNTFLYVLYRITGGKKRDCPACGVGVKKGKTICPTCNFDFGKAATGLAQEPIVAEVHKEVVKDWLDISEKHRLIQLVIMFAIAVAVGLFFYLLTWLLAPFSQTMDDTHCGINLIFNIPCTFRYQP